MSSRTSWTLDIKQAILHAKKQYPPGKTIYLALIWLKFAISNGLTKFLTPTLLQAGHVNWAVFTPPAKEKLFEFQ